MFHLAIADPSPIHPRQPQHPTGHRTQPNSSLPILCASPLFYYYFSLSLLFSPHFLAQGRIRLLKSLNHHKISCIKECFIVMISPLSIQLVELCVLYYNDCDYYIAYPLFPRVLLLFPLSASLSLYRTSSLYLFYIRFSIPMIVFTCDGTMMAYIAFYSLLK